MATELFSVKRFEDQRAMTSFANNLAQKDAIADSVIMQRASLAAQSNDALAQLFALMAQNEEHGASVSFLANSRKIVAAMPQKAASAATTSGLFSSAPRQPADTIGKKMPTPRHTG